MNKNQPIVVGIGASAGGLENFKVLLSSMPVDTGMAFVVVQHLAPDHESLTPVILARCTSMNVIEIRNGLRVKHDHIYVLPPQQIFNI
jgi:two-component system CheB/CheR fusion protein